MDTESNYAYCPTHIGHSFDRCYGYCSCGSRHSEIGASAHWCLWGFKPAYGPHPLKLAAGTLAEVNAEHARRTREGGWELGTRRVGHARPWFDGVDGRP